MSEPLDWNVKTIVEFRSNEGKVGGNFEGAPMVLVHHRGPKSRREYVTPMMYLPHDTEPNVVSRRHVLHADAPPDEIPANTPPSIRSRRVSQAFGPCG